MAATMMPSVILALSLSVLMHLGLFMRGEWHLQAPAIVSGHILAFILLLVKQYCVDHGRFGEVALPAATYLCGLLVCISVYRLYFHRLRSFPGPWLAALSNSGMSGSAETLATSSVEISQNRLELLYSRISSIFTRDKEVHDAQRKMWDLALSISSPNVSYERMVV
ncbi:hypothetical protein B0I37DRAFT_193496 [Chaetomium sp. MPI-CAGE-AT-0009]|nr:hypothetical protein B0I37DRAFT_193496 [Chaetomium sp. MPI-CAGE-AT-0009]